MVRRRRARGKVFKKKSTAKRARRKGQTVRKVKGGYKLYRTKRRDSRRRKRR